MTDQPISPAALTRPDDAIRDKWWKLHTVDGMKARAIAERTGFHSNTVHDYLRRRKQEIANGK